MFVLISDRFDCPFRALCLCAALLLAAIVGCSVDRGAHSPAGVPPGGDGQDGAGTGGASGAGSGNAGSGNAGAGNAGANHAGAGDGMTGNGGTENPGGSGAGTGGEAGGNAGGAAGAAGSPDVPPPVIDCPVACEDGVFCNGFGECSPGAPGANADGCVFLPPPCMPGQTCDEANQICVTDCAVNADADADGYDAIQCGGEDCNDSRPDVRPGATEFCNGLDDDCDGAVDNNFGMWACLLPNALSMCVAAKCEVVGCVFGFENCDGDSVNGCEVNVNPIPGDCWFSTCDGQTRIENGDRPIDDGDPCTVEECIAGTPNVRTEPNQTPCGWQNEGECVNGVCVVPPPGE
jgi:hypothetical protein